MLPEARPVVVLPPYIVPAESEKKFAAPPKKQSLILASDKSVAVS